MFVEIVIYEYYKVNTTFGIQLFWRIFQSTQYVSMDDNVYENYSNSKTVTWNSDAVSTKYSYKLQKKIMQKVHVQFSVGDWLLLLNQHFLAEKIAYSF